MILKTERLTIDTGLSFHNEVSGKDLAMDNLVIIDEAYVDFGAKSCVPFIDKYDNILVIQTFSKSRSLAGSRVGFALGNRELIADLNRIKFSFNPYNLDRLAIKAGAAAIRDREYFEKTRNDIMTAREYTTAALQELGYSPAEIAQALKGVPADATTEEMVRYALRAMRPVCRRGQAP